MNTDEEAPVMRETPDLETVRPWPATVLEVFGRAYLERLRRAHPDPYRRTSVAAWLLAEDPVGRARLEELDRWLAAARRLRLLDHDAMRRLKKSSLYLVLPKVFEFAALHFYATRLRWALRPAERADFEATTTDGERFDLEVKAPLSPSPAAFARLVHAAGKRAVRPLRVVLVTTEIAPGFEAQAADRAAREGRPSSQVLAVEVLRIGFSPVEYTNGVRLL
jgi:hypothetical protein